MADVDKEWVKDQLQKAVVAEQSLLSTEKDHRDSMKVESVKGVYNRIVADDEKHLDALKRVGQKYGLESTGTHEGTGGIMGAVKSTMEAMMVVDPFQTIGNDLMMKSNALNYDIAWSKIFQDLQDPESAALLEQAAIEDEQHLALMRSSLTDVGLREARGEKFK